MNISAAKHIGILLLTITVLVTFCGSWSTFSYPPRSVHQWRQSDCAAYVKTYYRNGEGLLQPATFNLAGRDGRVVSEFPVLYYLSAQVQHLTGEHYWVIRGLNFLCFMAGLIALLACCRKFISNWLFALLPVLLLATSPYYYYYAINFLPNVPAISFSFVGLYFFLQYRDHRKVPALIATAFFFVLATALKPTDGGIVWLACLGTTCCQYLFQRKSPERSSKELTGIVVVSVIVAAGIFGWTAFVNHYNDVNGNHQNLIGIYPFWEMDKDLFRNTRIRIQTEWINVYQQKMIVYLGLATLLIYFLVWEKLNTFLRLFTLFTLAGTCLYSALWFKAFTDHDYYQLPVILSGVVLCLTMTEFVVRVWFPRFGSWPLRASYIFTLALIAVAASHNRNIQLDRYRNTAYQYINPDIFELEPYLQRIGVKRSDHVVSVPDPSPNISLNAIGRYGHTEEFNNDRNNVVHFQQSGAAYLIISDSSYLTKELYQPFLHHQIGYYKGIYIFDIR